MSKEAMRRFTPVLLSILIIVGCKDMPESEVNAAKTSLSAEATDFKKTITRDQLRLDIPITQKREEWEAAVLQMALPPGIDLEADTIRGVPGLWAHPETLQAQQVIVYIHGGGLVEGSATTTRELASRLAKTMGMSVLAVDYRLAPEHPFPAALIDVKAVYRGLLNQYDPEQIVFGGDSNGGGLALASLISMRDEGEQLPAFVFLISPVVDLSFSGESMQTRAELDPFTSEEVLRYCAELYSGGEDVRTPLISPLFADLSALPPVLIQVGDHEILLSDSIRLAEKLLKASSKAILRIWPEMWHAWHYHPDLPESEEALDEIKEVLYGELGLE